MKKMIVFAWLLLMTIGCFAQKDSTAKQGKEKIKQFWMVILKTAPNDKTITDSVEKSKLFAGHFSNMERLYNEVILKVAGPFCENDFTWRGLFIYDCKTREDAEVFVKN